MFRRAEIPLEAVDAIVVASVVPQIDRPLSRSVPALLRPANRVSSTAARPGPDGDPHRPAAEVGADLVAAAIGARARYGAPRDRRSGSALPRRTARSRATGRTSAPRSRRACRSRSTRSSARTAKLPQVALDAPPHAIGPIRYRPSSRASSSAWSGRRRGSSRGCGPNSAARRTWSPPAAWPTSIARHTSAIEAVDPNLDLRGAPPLLRIAALRASPCPRVV